MCPYLTAVLCSVAAERLPAYYSVCSPIGSEVTLEVILGEDWGNVKHEEDPTLENEDGVGPEETIAAGIFACFVGTKVDGGHGTAAFNWARGYAKVSTGAKPRRD